MEERQKVRVRLVRSVIGSNQRVRATVAGLGLRRVGSERELVRSTAVGGMIRRVAHLVEVKE